MPATETAKVYTTKTATARALIDPTTKRKAERILKDIGLNVSTAFNLFYKQIILRNGLPFNVEIPNKATIAAIKEARQAKGKHYKNLEELYKDLGI